MIVGISLFLLGMIISFAFGITVFCFGKRCGYEDGYIKGKKDMFNHMNNNAMAMGGNRKSALIRMTDYDDLDLHNLGL